MHPYKQSGHWQYQAHPAIDMIDYTDAWKNYHKTACRSLPEDEYLLETCRKQYSDTSANEWPY